MRLINRALILICLSVGLVANGLAGERIAVEDVLATMPSNWKAAQLSVDLTGLKDSEVTIGTKLGVGFEAAQPGYLTYIQTSSHGDITLVRDVRTASSAGAGQSIEVSTPLGRNQLIVLFSNRPLDELFPSGKSTRYVGNNRDSAQSLLDALTKVQSTGALITARRNQFSVIAGNGGTEYTTRGIIRTVQGQAQLGQPRTRVTMPSRIEYEFGSSRLTDKGKMDLDIFGDALVTDLRDRKIVMEGHTDAVGSDDYNLALSEQRAQSARDYLVQSFGISSSRIVSVGKGKNDPVAPNDTDANRGRNRRVDFIFETE